MYAEMNMRRVYFSFVVEASHARIELKHYVLPHAYLVLSNWYYSRVIDITLE